MTAKVGPQQAATSPALAPIKLLVVEEVPRDLTAWASSLGQGGYDIQACARRVAQYCRTAVGLKKSTLTFIKDLFTLSVTVQSRYSTVQTPRADGVNSELASDAKGKGVRRRAGGHNPAEINYDHQVRPSAGSSSRRPKSH